jgi:nucleotide-binding universal stress UspA family protein
LHGATLRVVTTFESFGKFGTRYGMPVPVYDEQIAEKVEAVTSGLIKDVVGALPDPPQVQLVVRVGSAGPILTDEGRTAEMLIVGHSGHGAVVSALLGSVGLYCVLHAPCPVTVVRPDTERRVPQEAVPAAAAIA